MNWKTAGAMGLALATILHALFFSGRLPSILMFPGFIAHPFIGGLHGGSPLDPSEIRASVVEILINGALYMLVIRGVSRLVRSSKTSA